MRERHWTGTAYRLLMCLLPSHFRRRHGEEMGRLFDKAWYQHRGVLHQARYMFLAVCDLARTAVVERTRLGREVRRGFELGGVKEARREGYRVDQATQDLRQALRQLRHRPAFAAAVVVTLALGMGANTAVFSVVDGVLLRPLPYPEPERLAVLWTQFPSQNLMEFPASWPEYEDYRDQARSFEELAIWRGAEGTITGGDRPERIQMVHASWTVFPVLGIEPWLGRVFGEQEDVAGEGDVVVLSHGLWEQRYGADRSVPGSTVELNGRTFTILGVMPKSFGFPDQDVQAWVPMGIDPGNPPGRGSHFGHIVGRLAPGWSLRQASAELEQLMGQWGADPSVHSWNRAEGTDIHPAFLRSLHEETVGDVRTALGVLFGAVGIVLLIAVANVANLLLVRGEARLREIFLRYALGAGRGRVVRQLVTESLVLAVLGGVAGLVLAELSLSGLLVLAPAELPRTDSVGLDRSVLLFSAAVAIASGVLFGLAPSLQSLRVNLRGRLRDDWQGGTVGFARSRHRQLLVVSQTALAVVLLIGAGLLVQSFLYLRTVDKGFREDGVLTFALSLPPTSYPDGSDVTRFYRELAPHLAGLGGVSAVGMVRQAPLTGALPPNDIAFENRPARPEDPPLNTDVQVVAPGYFTAIGIPLHRGRVFEVRDDEESELVAVVDEAFVRTFFPDDVEVIGQRVQQSGYAEFARIVGIVGDVRQETLDREPRGQLYLAHAQSPRTWYPVRAMTVLLRAATDPLDLVPAVRDLVKERDADLPVYRVSTVARTVAESAASRRFAMLLLVVLSGVALMLAMVGVYGVLSYSVSRRTKEIGLRMALGAERRTIVRLVVAQGMVIVLPAIVLGVLGALAAGRVLQTLLFGISPRDPVTVLAVAGSLAAVALVACWIPARRASSVSPRAALSAE